MFAKDGHPTSLEENLSAGEMSQRLRALAPLARRTVVQIIVSLSGSSQTTLSPATRDQLSSSGAFLGHLHTCVHILMQLHTLTHK